MNPLDLPQLTKHVTDFSWVLSPTQVESLSMKFAKHEQATTEQVLTVFIPHRQWNELIDIWLKLFNESGIWQKELNNWLLLIVSTEEKKLRIITGKGMEIKYSEMVCREIVESHLRPLLNEGKYEEMVRKWGEIITTDIIEITKSWEESIEKSENKISSSIPKTSKIQKIIWQVTFWSFILLFLGVFIWDEQHKFLYICLLFAIPFLVWGIFWVFRWKETRFQKILFKVISITLGLLFLSGSYLQIYCHTRYVSLIPKNEVICKGFPIIMKNTWSGKNSSDRGSHSSSSSSSHSSYGGGGGSSNGGGYGD